MINDNQTDDSCYNNINEIAKRKMKVGFKVFNNEDNKLKIHKEGQVPFGVHNFNVTSRMKDYIDNIFIARETFKYTENGSVGLMTDDYRVLLLQASGSIFTNNDRYTPLEFSYYYLKEIFQNLMGFQQFHIVRAQGTAILDQRTILQSASDDMTKTLEAFYAPR